MSVQLFPAVEGYDKHHFWQPSVRFLDWKSLPQKLEELDVLAKQLGVEALSNFENDSRENSPFDDETMDEFERDGELINGVWYYQGKVLWSVEPKWFAPVQGLSTVGSLRSHLCSLQPELNVLLGDQDIAENSEDYRGVINELEEMEQILTKAQQENKRFRICISA